MKLEYFIERLSQVDEATWGRQSCWEGHKQATLNKRWLEEQKGKLKLSEILTPEEYSWLVCIFGTHLRAVNDGEVDYFMLGSTPKARVMAQLERFKAMRRPE